MTRLWGARLRTGFGLTAAVVLAAMGFGMPGFTGVTATAVVDADQTFRLHSVGPGQWQWTLETGRSAVGPSVISERVLQFAREDVAEIALATGLSSGDRVTRGQVLATVTSGSAVQSLDMLLAEKAEIEASRDLVAAGGRPEVIARAQQEVKLAEARRAEHQSALARLRTLQGTGAVMVGEIEQGELLDRSYAEEVAVARGRLAEAKLPARPEEIATFDAQLGGIQAEIDGVRSLLEAMASPIDGVLDVGTLSSLAVTGVSEMAPSLLRVYDLDPVYVRVPLAESTHDRVSVGAGVTFGTTAIPSRSFEGVLVDVSEQISTDALGHPVFWAVAEIANPDGALRPGMSGTANIQPSGGLFGARLASSTSGEAAP